MFESLAQRVHVLVPRPTHIESATKEIEARLLSAKREELTWVAYQYFFDCDFSVGLYYLPYALEDLWLMKEGYYEYAEHLASWLGNYQGSLDEEGVLSDVLACVVEAFHRWLGSFRVAPPELLERVPSTLRFRAVLSDAECRDSFLNWVLRGDVHWQDGKPLGPSLLEQWARPGNRGFWSAHLLDMLARSAGADPITAGKTVLYEWPEVVRMRKDARLLRQHLPMARQVWREMALPDWYVAELMGVLSFKAD